MLPLLEVASPLDLAALWRLEFLTGDDIAAICMRWLEDDLDGGDPDIAAFAGRTDLTIGEAGPQFERALNSLVGRQVDREEAILRGLRTHLAAALQDDHLMEGVRLAVERFASLDESRLVRHPRRATDHPDGVYAEENLGLEYVYGSFYAFDDIVALPAAEQAALRETLKRGLREDVLELHDHLARLLDERAAGVQSVES
ncbi:MAG TPA: hypothetical protein VIO94_15410 [Phenylobacterium sp.]